MSSITAEQLIFTRVEADYSPMRRGGYQTVIHPAALGVDQVKAIEKRVQCFSSRSQGTVRYQSFPLGERYWVITSTTVIPSHTEIIDRTARAGAFLAHCLILDRSALMQIGGDPFPVIDGFRFVEDAETLVELIKKGAGQVEVQLHATGTPTPRFGNVETQWLVGEALRAEETVATKGSLILVGDSTDIMDTLRLIMATVGEANALMQCSFDSHIDRCTVRPGDYWAVGTTSHTSGPKSVALFDVTQGKILGGGTRGNFAQRSLYFQWLDRMLAGHDTASVLVYAPIIRQIESALNGQSEWPADFPQADVIKSFIAIEAKPAALERLDQCLAAWLDERLRARLLVVVADALSPLESVKLAGQSAGAERALAAVACDWVSHHRPGLTAREWRQLDAFGRATQCWVLVYQAATLRAATWWRWVDQRPRDEALAQMNSDMFDVALRLLEQPVAPAHFVTGVHLDRLLERIDPDQLSDRDFYCLVKRIFELGQGASLGKLARRVDRLSARWLCKLKRCVRPTAPCDETFSRAIETGLKRVSTVFDWYLHCSIFRYRHKEI